MSSSALLPNWYDYRVVALSVLIAIFSSYAAFDVAGRVTAARRPANWLWWTGGTIALTFGIWSMHYSGMLAYKLPVPVLYDWPTVILSLLPALFGSAVALYLLSVQRVGMLRTCIAGTVSGCGIAGLHYIAMASMRSTATHHYRPSLVALSVVLAVAFSVIAFRLAFRFHDYNAGIGWRKILGAVIMGVAAISGMHYTAMAAARFFPSSASPDFSHAVSVSFLGTLGIGVVTLVVQGLAVLTSYVDRRFDGQHEISARILRSQDEERRRISRYLHETVAQSLAALKMNLAKISRANVIQEPGLNTALTESIELADESTLEVRTLSYLLHPPLLEETGLLSALRWYASGFQERSGITVTLDVPPELERLPEEIETAVFRIVQECLTNIHAHSGSPNATIRLARYPGSLVLQVQDSGGGIQRRVSEGPMRGEVIPGVGIVGIRERVHQLGGEMKIDSSDRGTRITVTLPVAQNE